jgi:hypothetical protein
MSQGIWNGVDVMSRVLTTLKLGWTKKYLNELYTR